MDKKFICLAAVSVILIALICTTIFILNLTSNGGMSNPDIVEKIKKDANKHKPIDIERQLNDIRNKRSLSSSHDDENDDRRNRLRYYPEEILWTTTSTTTNEEEKNGQLFYEPSKKYSNKGTSQSNLLGGIKSIIVPVHKPPDFTLNNNVNTNINVNNDSESPLDRKKIRKLLKGKKSYYKL